MNKEVNQTLKVQNTFLELQSEENQHTKTKISGNVTTVSIYHVIGRGNTLKT